MSFSSGKLYEFYTALTADPTSNHFTNLGVTPFFIWRAEQRCGVYKAWSLDKRVGYAPWCGLTVRLLSAAGLGGDGSVTAAKGATRQRSVVTAESCPLF